MAETTWLIIAGFVAGIYLLLPALVRSAFRFAARCHPQPLRVEELPGEVATLFPARVPEVCGLGFELVGYYDCGELVSETRSFVATFLDPRTSYIADVTVMMAPGKTRSYLEFSTRFSNGLVIETNTNAELPLSPPDASLKVFRFPDIQAGGPKIRPRAAELRPASRAHRIHAADREWRVLQEPRVLLRLHHLLAEKHAAGLCAQSEPQGVDLERRIPDDLARHLASLTRAPAHESPSDAFRAGRPRRSGRNAAPKA